MLTWLALREPPGYRAVREWTALLFASIGAAALIGGTVHGFFLDPSSGGARILWPSTLLALGVTALAGWGLGSSIVFTPTVGRWFVLAAVFNFLGYAVIVLGITQSFRVAVLNYLPAAGFLLIVFLTASPREGRRRVRLAAAGLVVSIAASAIQQRVFAAFATSSASEDVLYHVLEAVALVMIWRGIWPLIREAALAPVRGRYR